jgi:cytoskeleton protein RodZ
MLSASEQRERRLHLREVRTDEPAPSQTPLPVDVQETVIAEVRPGVGALLKARRIERDIDEAAVATRLKMRLDQLRAIEADDYSKLPGRTYAIGFVRAYAKFLGLDASVLVEQYKAQADALEGNKPVDLVFPEVAVETRWPNGSLVIVAVVVAVVIYGIAQITMPSREASIATAGMPAQVIVVDPAPVAKIAAPVSVQPKAAPVVNKSDATISASVSLTEHEPATAWPAMPASPTEISIQVASADGALPVSSLGSASTAGALDAPVSVVAIVPESQAAPRVPGSSRITLKAVEATYVQVRDSTLRKPKSVLLARVLNPGESFEAPDRSGLVLLTGNAGGIQVEVDGRVAGVLGKSGQVIKRLALEPAYFLSRIDTSR